MACNIGTSSQLAVVVDKPIFDKKLRVQSWCHTVKDRWVVQCGTLNGGSTLSWFRNSILRSKVPFHELDLEAGKTQAGAEGLYFLPYLAGERTPVNNSDARGVYFGLGMQHQQEHMVRATMEGVLFNLKECIGILHEMEIEPYKLISSGGASRGVTWKQIQADMLNMPVYSTSVQEEACHGAAILAAVGIGVYSDVNEACAETIQMSSSIIEPIAENVKIYNEKQNVFWEIYRHVQDVYKIIV